MLLRHVRRGIVSQNTQNCLKRLGRNPSNSQSCLFSVDLESVFHKKADEYLENIIDRLAEIENRYTDDVDISLSQGVLNLKIEGKGSWVINKQTPNRQLWWSSPISGPLRYEFCSNKIGWKCTRDGSDLLDKLSEEIKSTTGIDILIRVE